MVELISSQETEREREWKAADTYKHTYSYFSAKRSSAVTGHLKVFTCLVSLQRTRSNRTEKCFEASLSWSEICHRPEPCLIPNGDTYQTNFFAS